MKILNNVTIYSIDTRNPEMVVEALKKTCEKIKFASVILFSDRKPFNFDDNFTFIKIEKIRDLLHYSRFIMNEVPKYINTDFCMSIHADGYVINPHNWDDKFLDYDYIGGPWTGKEHFTTPQTRVGNGGVSIRSKKLLEYTSRLSCDSHEDTEISIRYRNYLINNGIKFAPLELAAKFSVEQVCSDVHQNYQNDCFAFHGKTYSDFHRLKIRDLYYQFYKNCLIKMDSERLFKLLDEEIGVSDASYFNANFEGNLEVKQNPYEYKELLEFFKNNNIKKYLEIGSTNSGSFFINSIFLQKSVDILNYIEKIDSEDDINLKKVNNKILKLKDFFPNKNIDFFNISTDLFFENNNQTYDCIFIDNEQSYENLKQTYLNSLKCLEKEGFIIFHDIKNEKNAAFKLWLEIKDHHKIIGIISDKNNCGIGILKID
jgi:hypothetical protein